MALKMHTPGKKPDWELVAPARWNMWQKIAARTKGVVTPANAISGVGAAMVVIGFLQFSNDITAPGLILIVLGRLADVIDGYVAHVSGTKSPLGEFVDTAIDKMTVIFGLTVILLFDLLPILFVLVILAQSLFNITASVIGRQRGIPIHPSQYGKLATFLAWIVITSYLCRSLILQEGAATNVTRGISLLAYIAFIFFVLLAVHSTASYIKQLRSKPAKR